MAVCGVLLLLFFIRADATQIVGGRNVAPHSRPYMASLQVRGRHNCGGVLVREDFVLTAAHCALRVPYTVVLGVDALSGDEGTKQELVTVRSILHPNYDGHENDIMLLQLNGRAQLTDEVQTIPLKTDEVKSATNCITAGWGDIGDNDTLATVLQEVNVTVLRPLTCRRRWGRVRVTRAMVCGVGRRSSQGFCSGDSGGPLVCDGAVAGVVSFSGRRCGNPRKPDVYSKVSSFNEWITSVINNNNRVISV